METAVIVALVTGVVTLIGYLFTRRGAREAAEQQARANQLKEREIDWARRGDIIQDLNDELVRVREAKNNIQRGCHAAMSDNIHTIELLQSILRDEVGKEIAHQKDQEARDHDRMHDL